ncbi:Sir2 silent information regulator family NAD-dependent deacetylase [Treponema medium]|uniref:Sir2 silent information regulator family NAD-dependent deacetylase n=1 Tax=Treponema medium TaxID=58231 RepID=A0ABX7LWF9_TREMD|nr:Sir2 silent information regulator family NAD-dependent deacetylase [Treponema medium]
MLNVSHCVFYKVVAVGFNTLCYDASVRGIKPSARIKFRTFFQQGVNASGKVDINRGKIETVRPFEPRRGSTLVE